MERDPLGHFQGWVIKFLGHVMLYTFGHAAGASLESQTLTLTPHVAIWPSMPAGIINAEVVEAIVSTK